ncbi:hypothetical protein QJS10_CPA06g00724 [Acorus calamus]|uniref:Homing endonuclease LAGLIDADG domain-containing protein n=1 Tax=Acorus calamus TaxID=4465 RepID=A0AAV9EQG0_ACOCL|nr:hypothetical protein QJS10_CPA06g00724 [Acorus calamus]
MDTWITHHFNQINPNSTIGETALKERFPAIFQIVQDRGGGADQFWSTRGETGFWEVQVHRNLNNDEVESYLELLELLQGCSVVPSRRDEIVWRLKPVKGFFVRSSYHWLCREISITVATARKYNEIWRCHIPLKVKSFYVDDVP